MQQLSDLENAALRAILDEAQIDHPELVECFRSVAVAARENTGGGFFTYLLLGDALRLQQSLHLGDSVHVRVRDMDYGLGVILHLKKNGEVLLEGYSIGGETTRSIDFSQVPFAIAADAGPLTANGS